MSTPGDDSSGDRKLPTTPPSRPRRKSTDYAVPKWKFRMPGRVTNPSTSTSNTPGDDSSDDRKLQTSPPSRTRRKRTRYAVPKWKFPLLNPFLSRNLGKHEDIKLPEINFELHSLNEKGELHCTVQARPNRKCPFCSYDAGSYKKLLKHCRRFHGDHHLFNSSICKDGTMSILAKPSISRSTINPEKVTPDYYFVRIRSPSTGCKRLKVEPLTPDDDGTNLEPAGTDSTGAAAESQPLPTRQYYHSRSRLPMRSGDWEVDSDDESQNEWLDELGQAGLNEFVDITEEEKRFLDLWKRFIRSDTVVPDDIIPEKCLIFIRDHVRAMQGLRQQLLMHMMTLWEHRLVSSSHILTCMKEYDSLHSTSK